MGEGREGLRQHATPCTCTASMHPFPTAHLQAGEGSPLSITKANLA